MYVQTGAGDRHERQGWADSTAQSSSGRVRACVVRGSDCLPRWDTVCLSLLENGADATAKDASGQTAIEVAQLEAHSCC